MGGTLSRSLLSAPPTQPLVRAPPPAVRRRPAPDLLPGRDAARACCRRRQGASPPPGFAGAAAASNPDLAVKLKPASTAASNPGRGRGGGGELPATASTGHGRSRPLLSCGGGQNERNPASLLLVLDWATGATLPELLGSDAASILFSRLCSWLQNFGFMSRSTSLE